MDEWYQAEKAVYGGKSTYNLPEEPETGEQKERVSPRVQKEYKPFLDSTQLKRESFISHLKELDATNKVGFMVHGTLAGINAPLAIFDAAVGNYWTIPVNLVVCAVNAYWAHRAYEGKYGENEEKSEGEEK